MATIRLPLTPNLEVRNDSLNKDSTLRNAYTEPDAIQEPTVIKRPGLDAKISALGGGNAMFFYGDQIYVWTYPLATTGDPKLWASGNGTFFFPYGQTTSTNPNNYRAHFVGTTLQDLDNTEFQSDVGSGFSGISDASFANGKFYINEGSGGAYRLRYSTDAITWTNATTPATNRVYSDVTGNATLLVGSQIANTGGLDQDNVIYSVDDGLNWSLRGVDGITSSLVPPYASNTTTVTNGFYHTTDGNTWTASTNGQATTHIAKNTTTFVGLNLSLGTIKTSTNGTSWTDRTWPFGSPTLLNLFVGNNIFYVYTYTSGTQLKEMYSSTDGITWTNNGAVNFPDDTVSTISRIRMFNRVFYQNILKNKKVNSSYLYARVPYLMYSEDGINWNDVRLEINGFDNSPTTISGI